MPLVSILVFLDQALKEAITLVVFSFLSCFNPCFPGSSAERKESPKAKKGGRVSILVFLDQALKACWPMGIPGARPCFNPCFPGSSAES